MLSVISAWPFSMERAPVRTLAKPFVSIAWPREKEMLPQTLIWAFAIDMEPASEDQRGLLICTSKRLQVSGTRQPNVSLAAQADVPLFCRLHYPHAALNRAYEYPIYFPATIREHDGRGCPLGQRSFNRTFSGGREEENSHWPAALLGPRRMRQRPLRDRPGCR